ncbi:hypothetical protein K469DRAFT_612983, partial [Zopfia rhizophila CBS 207.26]
YIKSIANYINFFYNLPIMEVCLLYKKIKKLINITLNLRITINTFNKVIECFIIIYLKLLKG